jgi:hypothetical protein
LEDFAAKVSGGLDKLDRPGQRDIIRALVKRIEVGNDGIEIIFRVPPPNAPVRPTALAKTRPAWQHVERSFAWMTRCRRLVKDYERYAQTLAGFHIIAFACLMLKRAAEFILQGA